MVLGLIKILGVILFLYLTWRNLNETYKEDKLVSYAWMALLVMLLSGRLTFGIINWGVWNESWMDWFLIWQKPGFNYLGMVVGFGAITVWYCQSSGWKIWAFFEDILPIFLLMMGMLLADELLKSSFSWYGIVEMTTVFVCGLISFLIKGRYRSWGWYKSGKKGFGFFFTTGIYSLTMAISSVLLINSWWGMGIYLVLSLISVGGLFILGDVLSIKKFNS